MPAFDYTTGFNHQVLPGVIENVTGILNSQASTTWTIDSSSPHHTGGVALKCVTPAASGARYWSKTLNGGGAVPGISAVAYIKFDVLPGSDATVFAFANSLNARWGIGFKSSTGQFCGVNNDILSSSSFGPVVATGVWYRLEFRVELSLSGYILFAGVATGDGTTTALAGGDFTGSQTPNPTGTSIMAGLSAITSSATFYVTDLAVSVNTADYPIGPIQVNGYPVNSVGTHNLDASTSAYFFKEISAVDTALTTSETTSYQTIDDVPINADNDGVWVGTTLGSPNTPSFRAAGTTTFSANNVANGALTPGAPAGKAVGDLLVMVCASTSNAFTITVPTGWTTVTGFPKASGTALGGKIYVLTRIADGTAGDTPAVTFAGLTTGTTGTPASVTILAYQNGTEVIDGTVASSDLSAQTTTSVIPAFTTATANSMVIGVALKMLESSGQTSTVATFTERVDQSTTSGTGYALEVSDKVQVAAGSSGTATVTWSATGSARALTVSLALKSTTPVTQPTSTWYAEYGFADESVITSAPLGVTAVIARNLDTSVSSIITTQLFDSAQGTNKELIESASVAVTGKVFAGKTFPGSPSAIADFQGVDALTAVPIQVTSNQRAISLQPGAGFLPSVTLAVTKIGSPTDSLIVEIQTSDVGTGLPTGTVVGTSTSRSATTIASSEVFIQFNVLAQLTSDKYWIVMKRSSSDDAVNYIGVNTKNTPAGGAQAVTTSGVWSQTSSTTQFRYTTTFYPAWTISSLNGTRLRFGLTSSASGHPRLEGAMLEAAFTIAGSTAYTDSATAIVTITPSSSDIAAFIESATATLLMTPTVSDVSAFVDAATASVIMTPSSVDNKEILDSATVSLAVTPSSADTAQRVDTATVSFSLTPSSSDGLQTSDSATVPLVVTPSSSDTYTPAAVIYTDSATVSVTLTPSESDTAQFVDTGTASLSVTPSSSDTAQLVDATTAALTLTPSASDAASFVDANSVGLTVTPFATDLHTITDANAVSVVLTPSETDTAQFIDTSTTTLTLTPSSTDIRTITDAATVSVAMTPSASDVAVFVDSATATVLLTPSSSDIAQLVDSNTARVTMTPSETDVFSGVDSATVSMVLTVTTTDVFVATDTSTVPLTMTITPSDTAQFVDTGSAYLAIVASSIDIRERFDANTVTMTLTPSETDVEEFVDTGTVSVLLTPSSTDTREEFDSSAVSLVLSPSSSDVEAIIDSGSVYIALTPSETDEFTPAGDSVTVTISLTASSSDAAVFVDTGAVVVVVNISGTDVLEIIDTNTATLTLTPSSSDVNECVDSATAILTITPSSTDSQSETLHTSQTSTQTIDETIHVFLVPVADISTGTWHDTPLYEKVDEYTPDPSDYIESGNNPVNDTAVLALQPASDPVTSDDHFINIQFYKIESAASTVDLTVRLKEGSTVISEQVLSDVSTSVTTLKIPLTAGEIDSIGDYANLSFELIANEVV